MSLQWQEPTGKLMTYRNKFHVFYETPLMSLHLLLSR